MEELIKMEQEMEGKMIEGINNIEEVEEEIKKLKVKKRGIKKDIQKKYFEEKKVRMKSKNGNKSNELVRVSINFKNKIDLINDKRNEYGLDCLSGPKITELIIKHKKWYIIERDIINYNTNLDKEKEEEEFNEK